MHTRRIHLLLALLAVLAAATVVHAVDTSKIVVLAAHYASIEASMRKSADTHVAEKFLNKTVPYCEIPLHDPHGGTEGKPLDNGYAAYTVNVPTGGHYLLWVRANWYDTCGNSFFVRVDQTPAVAVGQDATCGKWHWVKGKSYQLTAGPHVIYFQNREDGTKYDEFALVKGSYVPTRFERETPQ